MRCMRRSSDKHTEFLSQLRFFIVFLLTFAKSSKPEDKGRCLYGSPVASMTMSMVGAFLCIPMTIGSLYKKEQNPFPKQNA